MFSPLGMSLMFACARLLIEMDVGMENNHGMTDRAFFVGATGCAFSSLSPLVSLPSLPSLPFSVAFVSFEAVAVGIIGAVPTAVSNNKLK